MSSPLLKSFGDGSAGTATSGTCAAGVESWLVESKLHPPTPRPGIVTRTALLDRLESSSAPIVTVVAPGGYGKTTLLGQWAASSGLRSSWLSLDQHDSEPVVLLGYLLAALERVEAIDPERRQSLLTEAAVDSSWALRQLAVVVSSMRTPFLLVLDHIESVEGDRSGDMIAAVALNLPQGSRLALASRSEPPIPRARLRSQGLVEELGPDELKMEEREAAELLSAAGEIPDAIDVVELVAHTEGWPVGLYLARLAMQVREPEIGLARIPHGADRDFADYFRAEVLSNLAPSTVTFLIRTSILDRLCGPLCDAVVGSTGAQEMLESLEESNMLVVPLDLQRHWYRCHHLLGELLRSELERNEPEIVPRLHDRAATWFEANGEPISALDHAQAAGDAERAARLFGQLAQTVHGAGRADTVSRWLSWFEERGLIGRYPHVAVLGAVAESLGGAGASARTLADAVAGGDLEDPAPDGSPLSSWVGFMESCLCRHGVDHMRQEADLATRQLDGRSPLRGPATVLQGIAALLQGDAAADSLLSDGAELCLRTGNGATAAVALAERAALALDHGETAAAVRLSHAAVTIVEEVHLALYLKAAVVYAVAARAAAQEGDHARAGRHVAASARLRPLCTSATPWSAQFLVQLAHAYLALGDPRGARVVLRQVDDIVRTSAELGVVPQQCAELHRTLDTISSDSLGASSLTAAELRLLPLLATHLTYREIGERLCLSRNTIKSEAVSVLRKLGARSRNEAVEAAERIGLLGR